MQWSDGADTGCVFAMFPPVFAAFPLLGLISVLYDTLVSIWGAEQRMRAAKNKGQQAYIKEVRRAEWADRSAATDSIACHEWHNTDRPAARSFAVASLSSTLFFFLLLHIGFFSDPPPGTASALALQSCRCRRHPSSRVAQRVACHPVLSHV
jgi:hypothetical protein